MAPEQEFQTELKIPKERIAILIGKEGEIKKDLEDSTNTKIDVDSKEGDVYIRGTDGLNIFDAKEVVTAVGRGFNPKIAFLLMKGDYVFEIISIKDFANSQNASARLKGRIIGTEGKTRKLIEEVTESYISVYGKTISIIGQPESANLAKQAVMNLLRGAQHNTVYRWLEKRRKALKQREFMEKAGIKEDFE